AAEWDYELVWKFFGYIGGAAVFDVVMDTCGAAVRPASVTQVGAFLSEKTRAALRRQLAIAAHVLRAGEPKTAAAVVQTSMRLASDMGEQEDPSNIFVARIGEMLKS